MGAMPGNRERGKTVKQRELETGNKQEWGDVRNS